MRPIFLVGFMATGKSTVARLAAAAQGRRAVDLDDRIAARVGRPVAELVAEDEQAFRVAERDALAEIIEEARRDPAVIIATGGGAAAHHDNLDRMRAAGLTVALTASLDEARHRARAQRADGGAARPLLERDAAEVTALLERRVGWYRRAHAGVDTDGRTPGEVAAAVLHLEAAADGLGDRLRDASLLALGDRSYPVHLDDGPLDGALVARYLRGATRVAVIADDQVAGHWGAATLAALAGAGVTASLHTFPAGEPSKQLATVERLARALVDAGLDRKSAIVALGGGVTGDLAGFVAATLFRGVRYLQLPTSLVAMTDSAIGGKTGVDLGEGKNLVGAFWQPRAVLASVAWLDTLPLRERRGAFGELWKYALLDGRDLWAAVAALAPWARGDAAAEPGAVAAVVRRAAALKAWIVGRDERETRGERALLNLGHTVGHAIEGAAGWQRVHGECVALGLVAAARVSAALVGAPASLEAEVRDALTACGLDADLEPWLRDDVLERISVDKKRAGDRVGFVAVREVGRCEVVDVPTAELRRILRHRDRP